MLEVCSPRNRRAAGLRQAAGWLFSLAAVACLGGCGGRSPIDAGVDLYHGLQGGAIAEQRPPPPGADAPYPNLGTTPARPAAPDVAGQQRIADQLAGQRDAATRAAAASPLTPAAPPPATPKPPAAPDPNANRVVVDAAASPAAPATPPAPPQLGLEAVPAVPATVTAGPIPSLARAAPPPAAGLGTLIPPPPAAGQPRLPAPVIPASPEGTVQVAFTPGSATLPPSAPLNLRRFALAHKGVAVVVVGRGEAVIASADAQARALDLALRRAQAIAASLADAGVAAANLRLRAQATGQGGSASL